MRGASPDLALPFTPSHSQVCGAPQRWSRANVAPMVFASGAQDCCSQRGTVSRVALPSIGLIPSQCVSHPIFPAFCALPVPAAAQSTEPRLTIHPVGVSSATATGARRGRRKRSRMPAVGEQQEAGGVTARMAARHGLGPPSGSSGHCTQEQLQMLTQTQTSTCSLPTSLSESQAIPLTQSSLLELEVPSKRTRRSNRLAFKAVEAAVLHASTQPLPSPPAAEPAIPPAGGVGAGTIHDARSQRSQPRGWPVDLLASDAGQDATPPPPDTGQLVRDLFVLGLHVYALPQDQLPTVADYIGWRAALGRVRAAPSKLLQLTGLPFSLSRQRRGGRRVSHRCFTPAAVLSRLLDWHMLRNLFDDEPDPDDAPDYRARVANPVSLSLIVHRCLTGELRNVAEAAAAATEMLANCLEYNKPRTFMHVMAEALALFVERQCALAAAQ